ncbi:MAG: STAS domain-containing protein, partial [Candidatus Poribacteria bacterium]|nr:STAS domain-containing protein [Candidatus Poribacteria bacterium]
AAFGGIMSSGSPSRTVGNYQYGGRSRLSKVFVGLFSLVAIWFLAPWLGLLPQVVLAGLLISLAFSLLRKKTWHQMVDLFSHNNMKRQRSAVNLIISLTVSIFLIWQGILPSLGMGLLFSLLHFVIRMGRGIVADYRRGNEKHSFAIRSQEEFDELTRNGQCIHILHLQGSLFFGTADQLAVQIEEITHEGAHWIVLDLTEVVELDDTGNNIMAQLINRCRSNGVEFAFAVRTESTLSELLTASGLLEVIGVEQVFPSLNHALAWAEDQFLERHLPDTQILKENALQTVSAFRQIDEDHMIKIQEYLTWHEMPAGSQLIEQSSMEDWLIILVRGRVRVELRSNLDEKPRTVSYLCSGRLIGEFAFVDHAPRSASVITECEVAYWQMNYPDFLKLQQEDYWAAHQLMQGIAKEISTKLRISDQTIH